MVYLEHSSTRFWRCDLKSKKKVTIQYGKCGGDGRKLEKEFEEASDANDYITKQEASKRKAGYVDAEDPSINTTIRKRKQNVVTPCTSKKTGLANHASPVMDGSVQIDSGLAGVDSSLASRSQVHSDLHAKLTFVDPSKNSDKYYILQVIVDDQRKKTKTARKKVNFPSFYLFTRWGRTGTGGQAKLEGPFHDIDDAKTKFETIFQSKVGVKWDSATPGMPPKPGKYEYLNKKFSGQKEGQWFYFLKNDPNGKVDGWYPYDTKNSDESEELYLEYVASSSTQRLSKRYIFSESSGFTYEVNLVSYFQTNTTSGTKRPIMRCIDGKHPEGDPVSPTQSKIIPLKVTSTPVSLHKTSSSTRKVDSAASSSLQAGSILGEYDIMLNQTNLQDNNNKFYKIQLIEVPHGVHLFTKWGRVGESGDTQEKGPMTLDIAIKEFEKKFSSKTGNKWKDRDDFKPKNKKYSIVEMETNEEEANGMIARANDNSTPSNQSCTPIVPVSPCKLDKKTKSLVDLIFSKDMFNAAMSTLNLDVKKLPLGALSKSQIAKGFTTLEKIEAELGKVSSNQNAFMQLTSEFYTTIPHAFGRRRGPVIDSKQALEEKYEMLNTLTDIEAAQTMQKSKVKREENDSVQEHPSDSNYRQLTADLSLLQQDDKEFQNIQKYFLETKNRLDHKTKLRNVWRVNRHNESARFAQHNNLSNRKLLWHGTNVAVVAAILKSGLRIMPHSGGRVGRGIYLADQQEKSAQYVQGAKGTYLMFLVEAALGKQYEIYVDNSSLTAAPNGYDSVLAKGKTAPTTDETISDFSIDGNVVQIPSGKVEDVKFAQGSYFHHNEFLIYKESQHRIRYILSFDY